MGASSPAAMLQALGKYTLLEKIGEGYLGPVYRGFDQDLGRAVAVRVLCEGIRWDKDIEGIYHSCCRSVARLQHPAIAPILDFGTEGKHRYIVLESLGNSNLRTLTAERPAMTVESKLSIMIQVAEGLSHAHKNAVLHRDLGPAKIHLTADGRARIRDFAIASALMKHIPHPWIRFGAPIYLSPEQIQQKPCDPRTDIFSAGTIFYEFLTCHHPFHDRDSNKALDNILQDTQVPTFELFPDQPPGIWPILKTCLARDPSNRYQSMDELAGACSDLLKDLADDSRLMLSELYAALPPLRKAAAKPDAPEGSVALLHDIEMLLRGEKQADFVSLDRLMNALLEQYPAVQAASAGEVDIGVPEEPGPQPLPVPGAAGESSPLGPIRQRREADSGQGIANLRDFESGAQAVVKTSFTRLDNDTIFDSQTGRAGTRPEEAPRPESRMADPLPVCTGPAEPASGLAPLPPLLPAGPEQAKTAGNCPADGAPGPAASKRARLATCYRRIRRPSYRTTVVLLSLLLIAAAAYIVWGTGFVASLTETLREHMPDSGVLASTFARLRPQKPRNATDASAAGTAASGPAAMPAATEPPPASAGGDTPDPAGQPPREAVARISELIASGRLQPAKSELERLQQSYPSAPPILLLRRQWESKSSAVAQERVRKEEELQNAARKQKDDEWNRRLTALLAHGQYAEANSVLTLWLAEDPGNSGAREISSRIGEIQRDLGVYASAMAENRYPEALNAISAAEKLNPADSNFAELRRQIEARRASAKASLTVRRLGAKATILLDGRPVGNEGEMENDLIPIGNHTLSVESGGIPVASKRLEFLEGQQITLVYDAGRQQLRAMADADRELLAQRKAMEEVRYFDVEHEHGTFRGSCRGLLMVDYLDVAFRPSAGFHGFRMPLKLLKLSVKGKSIDLINISDNKTFQSFKLHDAQAAEKFKRSWDELKAFAR